VFYTLPIEEIISN
ncbi:unnamed protein product, partial [Adineta steineri]